jgi:hypothetical protein
MRANYGATLEVIGELIRLLSRSVECRLRSLAILNLCCVVLFAHCASLSSQLLTRPLPYLF